MLCVSKVKGIIYLTIEGPFEMFSYNQVVTYCSENTLKTALIAGSGLLLSAYVVKTLTAKKYKLPPGPKGWPFVGNLLGNTQAIFHEVCSSSVSIVLLNLVDSSSLYSLKLL